jgi:DnaJ-class molecular chaperone
MGEAPGDLILKVNLKTDPYFKRDNFDIYTKLYLTIAQVRLNYIIGNFGTLGENKDSRRR